MQYTGGEPQQQAVESSNTRHRPNTLTRRSSSHTTTKASDQKLTALKFTISDTKMTSTALPAAPEAGAPAAAAYHLYIGNVRPADCMGRRPEGLDDRRWSIIVYGAAQCKKKPVSDPLGVSGLCETCLRRCVAYTEGTPSSAVRTTDLVWHGRVDDDEFDSMPPTSHIAGSHWFNERVADGRLSWRGVEKPKTDRQKLGGGAAKRVLINDTTLQHFADGRIELDIQALCTANSVTAAQLYAVLVRMGVPVKAKYKSNRAALCSAILIHKRAEVHVVAEPKADGEPKAGGEPKADGEPKAKKEKAKKEKAKKACDLSALPPGTALNVVHKGVNYGAVFFSPTEIRGDDGVTYTSINKFACACTGRSTNAWTTVHYLGAGGLLPLDTLRPATPALSVSEACPETDSDAETVAVSVASGGGDLHTTASDLLAQIAALTAELAAVKERVAALSVF